MSTPSFPSAVTTLPPKYEDFFEWVPAKHHRMSTPGLYLVEVTDDLLAEYRSTVLPPNPTPEEGFYAVVRDSRMAVVVVHSYAQQESVAITEVSKVLDDVFFGDDAFDERDYS